MFYYHHFEMTFGMYLKLTGITDLILVLSNSIPYTREKKFVTSERETINGDNGDIQISIFPHSSISNKA